MIFLSICACIVLSLLLCLFTWQNPMKYIRKIRAFDWHGLMRRMKNAIMRAFSRLGVLLMRPLLQFFYTARDPEASFFDKLLIYLCLLYIIWPFDLIPHVMYRLLGMTDDILVISIVMHHTKRHIPPTANTKVENTLSRWFGMLYCAES